MEINFQRQLRTTNGFAQDSHYSTKLKAAEKLLRKQGDKTVFQILCRP